MERGDIIEYKVDGLFIKMCAEKHNYAPNNNIFCIFIKELQSDIEKDYVFVYYRISANMSGYTKIHKSRIIELPKQQQKELYPFFNKVKIIDSTESAYVFGYPNKKEECVGKTYDNYKRFENKKSKKLGRELDCLVIETEHGNLTFLHSDCKFIRPNINIEPKKDKSFIKNRFVRYSGKDPNIDKIVNRRIIGISSPTNKGLARYSSIVVTEDNKGFIYKDYKKNFKIV